MTQQHDNEDFSDAQVERVAKGLFDHAVQMGRDAVVARVLPLAKITTVFGRALTASDREAAIIIFCLIDDLATDFFREKLTGSVSGGVDEAFLAGNGMLATAHSKIALLAGLEWISKNVYRQLTLMRKIRNDFAHHVDLTAFNDSPIRDYVGAMEPSEEPVLATFDPDKRPEKLSTRTRFISRSALAVCSMVHDLAVIQAAIANRVPPGAILAGGFDRLPDNIKDLLRAGARIALLALEANVPPHSDGPVRVHGDPSGAPS
jgi:DNA-binding MltR family transcriptional regulator